MQTLETKRLILRSFKEEDLEDFYEYAKNPNIGPSAGWKPHADIEESKNILNMFLEADEVWAVVLKENNKLIGSVGLHKDPLRSAPDVKMLGYVLSEEYWGKGIIVEASVAAINHAFSEMGVNMVSVHHYPFNQKSRRVIEKLGFQYEGTLRHATKIYDESIYDLVCYSLTKDEWEAARN